MSKQKHVILNNADICKALKIQGVLGKIIAWLIMFVFSLNKLNKLYDKCYHNDAVKFCSNIMSKNNLKLIIPPKDINNIPEKGPVLIFLNHPYGGLDAMVLLKSLLEIRPDTKFLANFLLAKIEPSTPYLIQVNPFEERKDRFSSISGLKAIYNELKNGHPVVILPAGEVATKYKGKNYVEDRDWQLNIIKLAQNSKVPVISGFISGQNSRLFHLMGKISPVLRTAMIPRELLIKKNQTLYLRFSGMFNSKVISSFSNKKRLANVLKAKTYSLRDDTIIHNNKSKSPPHYEKIIERTNKEDIKNEIQKLKVDNLLFQTDNYSCFFSQTDKIPNIFREISRLREITFREVGEGTGKKCDSDKYDEYYNHLFIWDNNNNEIVGAYRIGMGADILSKKGIDGFYINTLFTLDDTFKSYLSLSMEMGRSFIVPDYQRKALPLFLLWKGIYHVTQKYPEYKYLIGPASI